MNFFNRLLMPHGKYSFLNNIKPNGKLLDVGCGNNSPFLIKSTFPNIKYTGLDIGEYNQAKPNIADEYIIVDAENFALKISRLANSYDAIISSHNLEHCNDRFKTLVAMIMALKKGGLLYLSFPTERSTQFPSRTGTLNYYDDPTHKETPPDFEKISKILKSNNVEIVFASKSYKPIVPFIIGFLIEPFLKKKKVNPFTWAYYGFESIIWAKKL